MKLNLLFLSLCLLLAVAPVIVEAEESPKQAGQDSAASAQKDLGMWWNKSSLTYSPMVKRLLLHTDITYSYTEYKGNLEGYNHDGSFMVALRKNRFTYFLTGTLSTTKYNIYVTQSEMKLSDNKFDNAIRFDAWKNLYIDAGYRYEDNTDRLLESRTDVYAGVGGYYNVFERFNFSMFFGGGQEEIEYDKMAPRHVRTADDPVGFVIQNGTVFLGPAVTVSDRVTYRTRLDDTENFDIAVKAMISVWLSRYFSLSYRYEMDHYNKAFPIARKTDEQHIYGVTLNLDIK